MSFDPKGTQPGLSGPAQEPKTVHMKCRTENCDSVRAQEVVAHNGQPNTGAAHNRMYRCVKCNGTWATSVGGHVSL